MKKIIVFICIVVMTCFFTMEQVYGENEIVVDDAVEVTSQSVQKMELPPLKLYAQGAVLMDAESGRVLYSKNGEEQLPMASTTKIMTLILTLERANLEDTVTVSAYAASMPDVQLNIKEGEQYRLKDLLYSLMLESHNDTAVAIAEHVGGSVENFAVLMNQKAQEIGCTNTWFITPNGLDATAEYRNAQGEEETRIHATTAVDLAKIMSYCITKSPCKEQFLEITRTASYTFSDLGGRRTFGCTNHNAFLSMMDGALSGKTGFTGKAGYCYVGALKRDERTYTVALLACGWPNHKSYKWSDTRQLMEYGLEYYTFHSLEEANVPQEVFEPVSVINAQTDRIGETAYIPVEILDLEENGTDGILLNQNENITVVYDKKSELYAPVKKGQEIGVLYYMVGEEEWKTKKIVTSAQIEEIKWEWCLRQVCLYWLI